MVDMYHQWPLVTSLTGQDRTSTEQNDSWDLCLRLACNIAAPLTGVLDLLRSLPGHEDIMLIVPDRPCVSNHVYSTENLSAKRHL